MQSVPFETIHIKHDEFEHDEKGRLIRTHPTGHVDYVTRNDEHVYIGRQDGSGYVLAQVRVPIDALDERFDLDLNGLHDHANPTNTPVVISVKGPFVFRLTEGDKKGLKRILYNGRY